MPGSLLECPLMVETFPIGAFLGYLVWRLAHDTAHAHVHVKGLKDSAHLTTQPSNRHDSYYFSAFRVGHFGTPMINLRDPFVPAFLNNPIRR